MHYIGIDLHKQSITICLVDQQGQVQARTRLSCQQPERILAWFKPWIPFQAVMEATASYEWLWQLLEPLADRLVLAHPGKMRIIAESTRKSDRYDARVLAEFLAMGMIPEAYRPSPRQRAHRRLVRHRVHLSKRIRRVKCKTRNILAEYNADRKNLFTVNYHQQLAEAEVSEANRFVLSQLAEGPDLPRGRPGRGVHGGRVAGRGAFGATRPGPLRAAVPGGVGQTVLRGGAVEPRTGTS